MQQEQEQQQDTARVNLDVPTSFLGLTLRQINDWEARHRQFCRLAHRQPCDCSAWE